MESRRHEKMQIEMVLETHRPTEMPKMITDTDKLTDGNDRRWVFLPEVVADGISIGFPTTVPSHPRLVGYTTDRGYPKTSVLEVSERATPVLICAPGLLNSTTHGSSKPRTELGPPEHWHRISTLPGTHGEFNSTNS